VLLGEKAVETFEIDAEGARSLHQAADMGAASRDLPAGAYTTLRTYDRVRLSGWASTCVAWRNRPPSRESRERWTRR
jgi:hypothetical protein